jgi:hypothetical protein
LVTGNVGLAMNGVHFFDLFNYTTEERTFKVTAWLSARFKSARGPQFEDCSGSVKMVTNSGKRFYLEAGEDQGCGSSIVYSGPRGQLWIEQSSGEMRLTVRKPETRELPTTRYDAASIRSTQVLEPLGGIAGSKACLQALIDGTDFPTAKDARLAVQCVVAAYVSDENDHRSVEVDDSTLPRTRKFNWA